MDDFFTWQKGENEMITPHFSTEEFACTCKYANCLTQKVSIELVKKLEILRARVRVPLIILSGFRCAEHQDDLRREGYETARSVSQHELGLAADITGAPVRSLYQQSQDLFKAFGVSHNFVHLDQRDDKNRLWYYAGAENILK